MQSKLTQLGLVSCNTEGRGLWKRYVLLSFDFIMLRCFLKVDDLTGSYEVSQCNSIPHVTAVIAIPGVS